MKKKYVNIVLLCILIENLSFSCKSGDKKINSDTDRIEIFQKEPSDTRINNQQDSKDIYSNLKKVDLNDIPTELLAFPLSWEKYGIDKGDTVTYSFCNASNPEFTIISSDFNAIQIIIGNELNQTFRISSIYYNDSIFKFILEHNNAGLNDCVFKWLNKNRQIGTLLLYGDNNGFTYMPKNRLTNKRIVEEECDNSDI
ncbi:MAG: hypothetical protein GX660_14390 [Clostridiaceae bacterium]|nr:hypothetical protein [Clostridiaceae bacterium]